MRRVATVSETGCRALGEPSLHNFVAGQQAAVTADAPATIVAAMSAHRGSEGVSSMGCYALACIAGDHAGKQACIAAGAVAAVTAAMESHEAARVLGG